ncbi:MAG TPA: ribosome biogenesis GTPase Der [Steroidobacteraceae bacterium]|jgi:GTP-binding protein|nr:ribosome biogenesis GTPase Der [Steroidobacteraceae bacterium]
MLPVIALVGRPNVGKSTLFNVLTGTRDAIVADVPGLTRDRQYGFARLGPVPCVVIDTGGLVENPVGLAAQMRAQTERAVQEADRLILLADARAGLSPQDLFVARELRRAGKPVTLALNKAEGLDADVAGADFHRLGFGAPLAISASHGQGCETLMEKALEGLAPQPAAADDSGAIRIAVIGRPNVGKSTLVNRLLGEERVIVSEEPGTTRDSILVPFERDAHRFLLIDTAGVRRRGRVDDAVERASVVKTLQAIDEAHVVIMMLDAHDTVAEQDASVLGLALQRGRALIIAVNKWDGIAPEQREAIRRQLALKLDFVPFAPLHFISARHGSGVGELMQSTVRAYDAAMRSMLTRELTRTLEQALTVHQPPLVRGRRIKLRYAHQGGRNPPRIVIHGNQTAAVPEAYTRYLANVFRKAYDLFATPVFIEYRTDANPYQRPRRPADRPARARRRDGGKRRRR